MTTRLLALLALLGMAQPALAATAVELPREAGERPYQRCRTLTVSGGSEAVLNAVAGNASAATRTVTINSELAYSEVNFQVDVTEGGTITAATVTFTCSLNGTTYGDVDTVEPAGSGTVNQYTGTWTKAITASGVVLFDFDISGCRKAKFIFGLTGGGASDAMTAVGNVCVL